MAERLQKLIASAGLCSRRTAEEWIRAGRVKVNGTPAVLGQTAELSADLVEVDGKALPVRQEKRYLMLNKPRGYVSTMSDEKGRPTVMELLADYPVRVVPVGRLDLDSEGLLLLTNDGEWMQRMLHPKYERDKTYEVTVAGDLDGAALRLSSVRQLDGEPIRRPDVRTLWRGRETAMLEIVIHEGKNRQIRRMCADAGLYVKRLRRVKEHSLSLGSLPSGHWRELTEAELRSVEETVKGE